jgi:hypothetical protein
LSQSRRDLRLDDRVGNMLEIPASQKINALHGSNGNMQCLFHCPCRHGAIYQQQFGNLTGWTGWSW